MRQVAIQPTFAEWKAAARSLLNDQAEPRTIIWVEQTNQDSLLLGTVQTPSREPTIHKVPSAFINMANTAALHSDPSKWDLLYRVLWRLTHGEPHLLENPADKDYVQLQRIEKAVQKDAYRMKAFIRFRETELEGTPWFVAWYEPEHDSLALNEEFFTSRFANMHWSILTPRKCMHWDTQAITYSEGATKSMAPGSDDVEALWITYYSNIFNPARLKPSAMQAQLLKRNWKNLPEAVVIDPLLRSANRRTQEMIDRSTQDETHD